MAHRGRQVQRAPLDDRRIERFNSDLAGRPDLVKGTSQILYGGMGRLSENSVLNLKNKSHSVTAELVVPDGSANGVIISQGGAFAGWSLYLHEGRPSTATTSPDSSGTTSRPTRPSHPAHTRSAWSSPTTAAGSQRAATSPCTSTVPRSGTDTSRPPSR
ncbi:hypothetical protein NKG05_04790 [Oerskovia sp. M15]